MANDKIARGETCLVLKKGTLILINKKLHQFKAYETLHPSFVKAYLSTFPEEITAGNLRISAEKLIKLFIDTLKHSSIFSMNSELKQLLEANIS